MKKQTKPCKFKRKGLALLLTAALLFTCGGCTTYDAFIESVSGAEVEEDTVRIGIFEPLTGADKEAAAAELRGIELAYELYPTVLGQQVELIYMDNHSDIELAEKAAENLVKREVDLVLGSYSNVLSLAARDIFGQAGIPSIAITNTNPLVTIGSEYSFRICYVDAFQGVAAAKYVVEDLGLARAAVLKLRNDDYGTAMAQSFSEKMVALTGDEKAADQLVEYKEETTDFTTYIKGFMESGVQVVYLPVIARDAALVLRQAEQLDSGLTFIGTDLWETDNLIIRGGSAMEGAVFTSLFDTEAELTALSEEFLKAYRAKYGEEENPGEAVALGFDAYLFALEAMKTAGRGADGQAIVATMLEIRDFQGATGSITLDENGDPIRSFVIKKVKDGEYVFEDTAEPVWADSTGATGGGVSGEPAENNN